MSKPSRLSVGWTWVDRDGSKRSLAFGIPDTDERTIAEARSVAIEMGYPGHAGGWWNYMVHGRTEP